MVFLQGCRLRCKICSNPDTWDFSQGHIISSDDLIKKIAHVKPYIKNGGVTFSGGEPLLQAAFTRTVFEKVRQELGLTTCLDTAGHAPESHMDLVLPHVDHVLFCIKHPNPVEYKRFTGREQTQSLLFLDKLGYFGKPFTLRYVIVPGMTDKLEDIDKLVSVCKMYPSCTEVELLPYHTLGKHKWHVLGVPYPCEDVVPPSKNDVDTLKAYIESKGIKVVLG
jgi:pyruvate formate lyase activating enzyme